MVNREQVETSKDDPSEYFHVVFIVHSFQGKTLLAKAVANQTSATFLRVVGSELIQKYLVIHFSEVESDRYSIDVG
jgi:AAA+ superfamily predicted ATPase